jgi:hypothetical protein
LKGDPKSKLKIGVVFWFQNDLTWLTRETHLHLDDIEDDKRWGTIKRQECRQGMTK